MKLRFHKNFDKQYSRLRKKEKDRVHERLSLFMKNPFFSLLNNHPLKGKYLNYRSINITGDLRAIYRPMGDDEYLFVAVDKHSNLYR